MRSLMNFLHVLAAIAWLGGITFILLALRPAAARLQTPPHRLPLMALAFKRFFRLVWVAVAVLLVSGLWMLMAVGMKNAPAGWHAMLGIGLLMFALFGHIYFGPFRRLEQAVVAANWTEAGRRAGQIATLSTVNLGLGVLAIAAVYFLA